MSSNRLMYLALVVTFIILFCTTFCNGCVDDDDRNNSSTGVTHVIPAVCNDTSSEQQMPGNIKRYQKYSTSLDLITDQLSAYFTVASQSERKRVRFPSGCNGYINMFIMSSMESGDFMQANRIRYTGNMCSPRKFTNTNKSVLFGMKVQNSTTSTSNFTVGYTCHVSNMGIQAENIYGCEPARKYMMSSSEAHSSLANYLRSTTDESIAIGRNPGQHICQLFKYVISDCKKTGFDHIQLNKCN